MGKGTVRNGAERPRRTPDPSLSRGSPAAAAPDARRRQARTAEASQQQTRDGQKDDGSRTMGKRTILSKARPTAEIPPFYVFVNNRPIIASFAGNA